MWLVILAGFLSLAAGLGAGIYWLAAHPGSLITKVAAMVLALVVVLVVVNKVRA